MCNGFFYVSYIWVNVMHWNIDSSHYTHRRSTLFHALSLVIYCSSRLKLNLENDYHRYNLGGAKRRPSWPYHSSHARPFLYCQVSSWANPYSGYTSKERRYHFSYYDVNHLVSELISIVMEPLSNKEMNHSFLRLTQIHIPWMTWMHDLFMMWLPWRHKTCWHEKK